MHTEHEQNAVPVPDPRQIQGDSGPWEVVVGLEVHAQVASRAKLFSCAPTAFGAAPNSQVDWVDAGFPGMLPVLNGFCVEQAVRTGLGFHGTIQLRSRFDRKNYFYADLPCGYQISQFYHPVVTGGWIDLDEGPRVRITRLHLEQDAGKCLHDQAPESSLVDLNRAGVALMEIVSEPDMRSAGEAASFMRKLRILLRHLGTCDGNMEEGSLRADANVSVRRPGEPLGVRCEIKNLNSMRFLAQAVTFEARRQIGVLEHGGVIRQETRLFDPGTGETRTMRSKEDAHDYRYFPDPDLPPLVLDEAFVDQIRAGLPELPDNRSARWQKEYGLTSAEAAVLVAEPETAAWYEEAVACLDAGKGDQGLARAEGAAMVARWLVGDVFAALNASGQTLATCAFRPRILAELVTLVLEGTLSGKMAKDLFAELWATGASVRALVEQKGLKQVDDRGVLDEAARHVLAAHEDKVREYVSGKEKLFGFFVGQTMKHLGGKAHPALLNTVIQEHLDQRRQAATQNTEPV